MSMSLSYNEKQQILTEYLNGKDEKELAKQFKTTKAAIIKITTDRDFRTTLEKKHFELVRAKESRKIDELKNQIMDFIKLSLDEAMDSEESKIKFLDKLSKLITDLDKISRLNRGEVTDSTSTVTKHVEVDVAKVLKELDTPEKKKAFLLQQISYGDTDNEN